MRPILFLFPSLLSVAATADSSSQGTPDWVQRAMDLGLRSAYVVLEYSLTDDCDLGPVRVTESSSSEVFDAAAIGEIIRSTIGPFEIKDGDTSESELSPVGAYERLLMTNRMFSWNTDLGHQYLACKFSSDGRFASAYYTDGRTPREKTVENRPVARRLSQLGTRTHKLVFEAED